MLTLESRCIPVVGGGFLISRTQPKQLSRGEICVANFITPANGVSQGNYFLPKSQKLAVFESKMSLQKTALAAKVANFF